MLVISVLCFSTDCGLGGAFCGGELLVSGHASGSRELCIWYLHAYIQVMSCLQNITEILNRQRKPRKLDDDLPANTGSALMFGLCCHMMTAP